MFFPAYLIYGPKFIHSNNVGFSLNMAGKLQRHDPTEFSSPDFDLKYLVSFTSQILWWVRILNDTEVSANR
jgi:hypothetical protein